MSPGEVMGFVRNPPTLNHESDPLPSLSSTPDAFWFGRVSIMLPSGIADTFSVSVFVGSIPPAARTRERTASLLYVWAASIVGDAAHDATAAKTTRTMTIFRM